MKRLFLIRHAESVSNAGGRTTAPHSTLITDRGRGQAAKLAGTWSYGEPNLIVTSRFIRTKHTGDPFVRRFPRSPVTQWPVEEFTQLDPKNWEGTTHPERMPKVMEYWERADPNYRDGPGAETFADFIGRVEAMLTKAAEAPEETIVVFTHGHFIQATIYTVLFGRMYLTTGGMRGFFRFAGAIPIDNTAVVSLMHYDSSWRIGAVQQPATPI